MKSHIKLITALALCVAMLSACSMVEVNPERVVVATVDNDVRITLNDFLYSAIPYLSNEYQTDASVMGKNEYPEISDYILESLIDFEVQKKIIEREGIAPTQEDYDEANLAIEDSLNSLAIQYGPLYQDEDMTEEEGIATARYEIDKMYFSQEYTREDMIESYVVQMSVEKLKARMLSDIDVTYDEAVEKFNEIVAEDTLYYVTSPEQFGEDYANNEYFYVPDGVRMVKHILIAIPEAKRADIQSLRNEGNDAEADALVEAELALIFDSANEVLAKVEADEDFDALIEEYGEDPGMEEEPYKSDGYMVYPGSTDWVAPFHEAAMALDADGDVSGLVPTDFGYHIIKRVSTIESGAQTDKISSFHSALISTKKDERFNELLEQWKEELNVKRYTDRIDFRVQPVYN